MGVRCRAIVWAGLLAVWSSQACHGAGHLWSTHPAEYPSPNRLQVAGGSITYTVDLQGLRFSRRHHFSDEQIAELEAAAVRAFDKWNEVLEPMGLRFEQRPIGERAAIPVFALAYETYFPPDVFGDTVATSTAFPLNGVMNFSSIVIDADDLFEPLDLRPTAIGGGLHHPYLRYVDFDGVCMFTTILHELGHGFGLGHPQDMFAGGRNFAFLSLESVQTDAGCMAPSDYVSGENLRLRGRFLPSELDSIMAPLQIGATATDIPPEDRAFVAFVLRSVDPEGADLMLREARELWERTWPFRFLNVVPENEVSSVGVDNDSFATAVPVEAGWIILGSLPAAGASRELKDQDYFRFEVGSEQVGRSWVFDVDLGGGLTGANWVDAVLELYGPDRTLLAVSDDAAERDEGSFSTVDPYLGWSPQEPGEYFLRLAAGPGLLEPGGVGDYELKIGIDGVPEPTGWRPIPADPSVGGCEFQPLVGRPLTPMCGLFDMVGLSAMLLGCVVSGGCRRACRARPRAGAGGGCGG